METWHSRIFLIFMLKGMVVYILKIGLNFYFGRNNFFSQKYLRQGCFQVLGPKVAQNEK